MGRLGSLLFLGGLAFASVQIPKRLPQVLSALSPASESSPAPLSGDESDSDVLVMEKKAFDPKMYDQFDEATKGYAMDANPTMEIKMNPLIGKMMDASRSQEKTFSQKKRPGEGWRRWCERNKDNLAGWSWKVPGLLLSFGALLYVLGYKGSGRACVMFCYALERKWLFLLSVAAVLAFTSHGVSLWAVLPGETWGTSIGAILACGLFLRMIDMNYPIWNSTIKSFLAPLTACVVIFVWDKAAAGLLAKAAPSSRNPF